MTEAEWIKKFADKICEFYGEEFRAQAERAASDCIQNHGLGDDPIASAVLVMEGWSMFNG